MAAIEFKALDLGMIVASIASFYVDISPNIDFHEKISLNASADRSRIFCASSRRIASHIGAGIVGTRLVAF